MAYKHGKYLNSFSANTLYSGSTDVGDLFVSKEGAETLKIITTADTESEGGFFKLENNSPFFYAVNTTQYNPPYSSDEYISMYWGYSAGTFNRYDNGANVGLGSYTLSGLREGTNNLSGNSEAGGFGHIAIGYSALSSSEGGIYDMAIGFNSMSRANIEDTHGGNIGLGAFALKSLTSQSATLGTVYNEAIGYKAMEFVTDAENSIGIGSFVLQNADNLSHTVAIGSYSQDSVPNSFRNIAVGFRSLSDATFNKSDQQGNVGIGDRAGRYMLGDENIYIGTRAGFQVTGVSNVFLGYYPGETFETSNTVIIGRENTLTNDAVNAVAIGSGLTIAQSNSIIFDNSYSMGLGTNTPQAQLHVTGDVLSNSSVSGQTFYSGSTDISDLFAHAGAVGDTTRVQGGTNISTGGTANAPVINLDDDISLSSVDATDILSGSTNISDLFVHAGAAGDTTRVQGGTNISTGGTANAPVINLDDNISLSSVDAANILSGGTNLNDAFNAKYDKAGGTISGNVSITGDLEVLGTATTLNTETVQSEDNNIDLNFGGSHISAIGGGITVISGQTDGSPSEITTDGNGNWVVSPGLNSVGVSGDTLYSGSTDVSDLFVHAGSVSPSPFKDGGGTNSITTTSGTNTSNGVSSFAVGASNLASGNYSFASGLLNEAISQGAHAEGVNTRAHGSSSHAEGTATSALTSQAHAEGYQTSAAGLASHAEGRETSATTNFSHTEGYRTWTNGTAAHAEGFNTQALNIAAHAEGGSTTASGVYSHAEGRQTTASGAYSHAEGRQTQATSAFAHSEGYMTYAFGAFSHAQGRLTTANTTSAHAEGVRTFANSYGAHAEGVDTSATGYASHAQNNDTTASGSRSHAGGYNSVASANEAFAHGNGAIATTNYSVSMGINTSAVTNQGAVSIGWGNLSSGFASAAFGMDTSATAGEAFACGHETTASGQRSFVSGDANEAEATHSGILGGVNNTLTSAALRSVILGGQNITGTSTDTAYVPQLNIQTLGDGSGDNEILTVDNDGNIRKRTQTAVNNSITTFSGTDTHMEVILTRYITGNEVTIHSKVTYTLESTASGTLQSVDIPNVLAQDFGGYEWFKIDQATGFVGSDTSGNGDFGGVEISDLSSYSSGVAVSGDTTKLFFAGTVKGQGRSYLYDQFDNQGGFANTDRTETATSTSVNYLTRSPKDLTIDSLDFTFLNNASFNGGTTYPNKVGTYYFVVKGMLI